MTTKTGFKVTSVSTLGTKNVLYVEVKDYEHNGITYDVTFKDETFTENTLRQKVEGKRYELRRLLKNIEEAEKLKGRILT